MMPQSEAPTRHRLGPFTAGATSSELRDPENQANLGLRLLGPEDQQREYDRTRCTAIHAVAREFFYNYEGTTSLIFQKLRETPLLPNFVEYVYCWFANDCLCGTILSGVTSDAGSHAQINEQEILFGEHAAEVSQALSGRYPEHLDHFVNHFNFEIFPSPPLVDGLALEPLLTNYQQLVTTLVDGETQTRIGGQCCGPALLTPARKKHETELHAAATHSSQSSSQAFANAETVVVYDFKVERYVRTIESIHVFENLVYLSRSLAQQIGQRLNAERCDREKSRSQAEIDEWNNSLRAAEQAKASRIEKLSEIL